MANLLGIGSFVVLLRVLSKDDFGTWALYLSLATLLEFVRNGFIRNPLVRYLTNASGSDYVAIVSSSFALNLSLAILEILIIVSAAPFIGPLFNSPHLSQLLYYYTITSVALVPLLNFNFVEQSNLSFQGTFYSGISRKGLFFSGVLFLFLSEIQIQVVHLVLFDAASIVAASVIAFFFCRPFLRFAGKIDSKWFSKLFSYGRFTFGSNINSMLLKNMGSWMLAGIISPQAVTLYNPAQRVSQIVELPTTSLTAIIFPQIARRYKEEGPGSVKRLYEKGVGLLLAFMVPVVVVVLLLAEPIVFILAGDGFQESVPLLRVLILLL